MPCYFFHIENGDCLTDDEGEEFPDNQAALQEAELIAGDLSKNQISRTNLRVIVTDCKGEQVCEDNRDVVAAQPPKSPTVLESQSLQDQQLEERQRFAERLVQDLREAGYSCELGEDGLAWALKPLN
jgi:hypothetical protein